MRSFLRELTVAALQLLGVLLLVLVVLVALILGPVLLGIRPFHPKEGKPSCLGNVVLVTMALKTYADDYDGEFPFVGRTSLTGWKPRRDTIWYETEEPRPAIWPVVIDPYVKSLGILACPASGANEQQPFSYFFNRRLSGLRMRAVRYPANCIALGDWIAYGYGDPEKSTTWDIARSRGSSPLGAWHAGERHEGSAVYGFVDGHATNLRRTDIVPSSPGGTRLKPDPRRPSFVP